MSYKHPPKVGSTLHDCIVVATVFTCDDDERTWTMLVLSIDPREEAAGEHYVLSEIALTDDYPVMWFVRYPNIVPAVEAYQQNGGDW